MNNSSSTQQEQALARMGYGTVKLSDTVDINGSISSAVFTINEED